MYRRVNQFENGVPKYLYFKILGLVYDFGSRLKSHDNDGTLPVMGVAAVQGQMRNRCAWCANEFR